MVNDLRRKIKNETLARRLKQLLRNWQTFAKEAPLVNGMPTQAIAKFQLSPAVSPSPTAAPGVNPVQRRGKSNIQAWSSRKSASPALQSIGSSVGVGGKEILPSSDPERRETFHDMLERYLTPVKPSALGRVVSPLVSCQVSSSVLSSHRSPEMELRTSITSSNQTASQVLNEVSGQSDPQMAPSPPILFCAQNLGASSKFRSKGKDKSVSDKSDLGGSMTPTSLHSENSQDRVIGDIGNGRQDSDDGSYCSSRSSQSRYTCPPSHSTDMLKNINSNNPVIDQRERSKANVASRKRACKNSASKSKARKKGRTDSSSLPFTKHRPENVVNGHKKTNESCLIVDDSAHVSSFSSIWPVDKNVSSPQLSTCNPSSDRQIIPLQSHMLLCQKNSDSSISAQTSGLLVRGKHKVKTTQELIQDLLKKNRCSVVGSSSLDKLCNSQTEKEREVAEAVMLASVKPWGKQSRKGKNDIRMSVPSSDVMLSKNELVERFLKTSDPSGSMEDYSIFRDDMLLGRNPVQSVQEPKRELGVCNNPYSKDSFDGHFTTSRQDNSESAPKDESSMDAISQDVATPPKFEGTGTAFRLQEIYAQLPPVEDDIDWDSADFYELPEKIPVTEERINQLHDDRLPGINGMYNINGAWTKWQQILTLPSYEGNQLHILPYVDLDN